MIPLPQFEGKAVRVVGLGPAGQATVEALSESGAKVTVWDDDADVVSDADQPPKGPRASLEDVAAVVICDGGVAKAAKAILPKAKEAGVEVLTDLDLFADAIEASEKACQVVGVTGLKGMSAAPTIAHIVTQEGASVVLGGGRDRPVLSLPAPKADGVYVLELPVTRLAATRRFRADVSVVQDLTTKADQAGLDAVLRAVMRLFRSHAHGDAAVISVDDGLGQKLCTALQSGAVGKIAAGEVIPISGSAALGHGVYVMGARVYSARSGRTQDLGCLARAPEMSAPERACEAAAAVAACLSLGVAPPAIIKALHSLGAKSVRKGRAANG